MSRKIRVKGLKHSIPKKTRGKKLERTVLESPKPSSPEEGHPCRHYSVCPDRKRCDKYGRVRTKGTKFYKKCEGYLQEEVPSETIH